MTVLRIEELTVQSGAAVLVEAATLAVSAGELVVVLGPNGAGKTSLLKGVLGLAKSVSGRVDLSGRRVSDLSPMNQARLVSYLPQKQALAWPNRVRDLVALGRFSHGAAMGRLGEADAAAVESALKACDVLHLAERRADTLSGGEISRVHFARAFAAGAPFLIADEPVAALDPRHQFRVMDLISGYVKQGGGALVVLHDIALAAKYADRLIWMQDTRIIADGTVEDTLTPAQMAEIYGVAAKIDGRRVEVLGPL
jgi:iron complex transport system ATP-binding protein